MRIYITVAMPCDTSSSRSSSSRLHAHTMPARQERHCSASLLSFWSTDDDHSLSVCRIIRVPDADSLAADYQAPSKNNCSVPAQATSRTSSSRLIAFTSPEVVQKKPMLNGWRASRVTLQSHVRHGRVRMREHWTVHIHLDRVLNCENKGKVPWRWFEGRLLRPRQSNAVFDLE